MINAEWARLIYKYIFLEILGGILLSPKKT